MRGLVILSFKVTTNICSNTAQTIFKIDVNDKA